MRERAAPEQARLLEPIRRHPGADGTAACDAILRRFLLRRIGRPWDEVYSQICASVRPRGAVSRAVLACLRDLVHTRVVQTRDLLLQHGHRGVHEIHGDRWAVAFVCPTSGLLRRIPPRLRARAPAIHNVVPIDAAGQYRKIGRHWFKITLSPVPQQPAAWAAARDVLLGDLHALGWQRGGILRDQYGRSNRYATDKRQLGRRALRRLLQEIGR